MNKLIMMFITLFIHFSTMSTTKDTPPAPIKIILNNWSSQLVLSHIVGKIFQTQGYTVEYTKLPIEGQWFMLKAKKAHVQVEVWQGTMSEKYQQLKSRGWLVDAGTYDIQTREEWWYPDYVEPLCPGLPDWRALKNCYQLFTEQGSKSKGIYYGGPWEKPDKARVRALGLPFIIITVDSADELWSLLEKAYQQQKPIILFNWTPNWVGSVYRGNFVDFPEFHIDCELIPEWGINKNFLYDCGNPKSGWLKKVVAANFPETWPCPNAILNKMNFTNIELEKIAALVDQQKMTITGAAEHWLENNPDIWHSWLVKPCKGDAGI